MFANSYTIIDLTDDATEFFFVSQGIKGDIPKMVKFFEDEQTGWTFAFGNYTPLGLDVKAIVNNFDLNKVINTVANAIETFFEHYPERSVYFKPVDERRKKIFNYLLGKRWKIVNRILRIIGILENVKQPYHPDLIFDAFIVTIQPLFLD